MPGSGIFGTMWTMMLMLLVALCGLVGFSDEAAGRMSIGANMTNHGQVFVYRYPVDQTDFTFVASGYDNPIAEPKDLLITYVYTEATNSRENLLFFLKHGLHPSADFVFILNGFADVEALIPTMKNVRIISLPVTCVELGAHGKVLRKGGLWKKYNHFITLSSAVRGPFMPYWSRTCWTDVYLSLIVENVKLVGMAVNCHPKYHVQSMIWATDSTGMDILLHSSGKYAGLSPKVAYDGCNLNPTQAIRAEVDATRVIKKIGYEVDALMGAFHRSDDFEYEIDCSGPLSNEVFWNEQMYNTMIYPYDTIFVMMDHNMNPDRVADFNKWHEARPGNSSWDVCG